MSSADSQRPIKRQRTEDRPDLVRSEIWKPYGDTVLQAQSTLFKVNRTILVEHSSVFEGMFSIPQPHSAETIDGCPMVELSDTAQDIELLLAALYDPYHNQPHQPFEVIACMLRLGKKYEIDRLTADAVLRIRHDFPNDVQSWERKQKLEKIEERAGLEADLLNLVLETGLHTSVPVLAHRCLEIWTLSQLFRGVPRPDGSRVSLADDTKFMLSLGLERLREWQCYSVGLLQLQADICISCPPSSSTKFCQNIGYTTRDDGSYTTKIVIWQEGEKVDHIFSVGKAFLCRRCGGEVHFRNAIRLKKIWERLPNFFGLPAWKDLRDNI
ncbi:hypothetical protein FB45DRAFT_997611 [Roridomyces roridus]|uniref:BTB domain-containing protein n=1 Tax=Roridomyces roridus TaxID=1738132 RepID=A0AAD7CK35_9AGAR|nr:hypothetical protein FB45DRAFT_997611 [Roridomyces roridus]